MRRQHYTGAELDAFAIADLLNDAECSEKQAAEGPFYPELGVTRESCLAYAAKCREVVGRHQAVGAHAVLSGKGGSK